MSLGAGSGSDAASLMTKAVFDEGTKEYVINGGKAFISGAGMRSLRYIHVIFLGKI